VPAADGLPLGSPSLSRGTIYFASERDIHDMIRAAYGRCGLSYARSNDAVIYMDLDDVAYMRQWTIELCRNRSRVTDAAGELKPNVQCVFHENREPEDGRVAQCIVVGMPKDETFRLF